MKMKRIFVLLLTTWAALNMQAQDSQSEKILSVNGYGRGSAYAGGESFDMASAFAEISLQPSIEKKDASLKSDLRFRTGYFFNGFQETLQIRELYAGYHRDKFGVLLGNQIVNWGRTDGFNPTNNITPNDYFFLSADPNDQKLSNFMLKFNYRPVSGINLEWIGIPFYKMSNYRFDLFDLKSIGDMGDMLGMSDITPTVTFGENTLPARKLKNASFAFRADFDYPAFGGSLSYFHGYDPYHGIEMSSMDLSTEQPVITIASVPYRKSTVGGDFAIPVRSLLIRGEAAYNSTNNKDNEAHIPNSDLSFVAGLELNVGGVMLLPQYIGKYTLDFKELTTPLLTDPTNLLAIMQFAGEMTDYQFRTFNRKIFNQQEKWNHAVSFTASKSFAYDQLNADLTAYYNFTTEEYMIRPCIVWKINDILSLSAGGIYMHGKANTLYNYSSKVMNGGFIELKASF